MVDKIENATYHQHISFNYFKTADVFGNFPSGCHQHCNEDAKE